MIPHWLRLSWLTILTIGWLSPVWGEKLSLPDIKKYGKVSDWFHVIYERSIRINNSTTIREDNLWSIEEYFALEPATSIAFHRNNKANLEYTLVAYGGHYYYCQDRNREQECWQDLRQDYSTTYPWRFSKLHEGDESPKALLGMSAVWMNAIDRQLTCRKSSTSELICSLIDRHLKFEITFVRDWPAAVLVQQYYHIYEDGLTVTDSIASEISVKTFEILDPNSKEKKRIQDLTTICDKHKTSDTAMFPSLMRFLSESAQKNYHLSYTVTSYESTDSGKVAARSYLVTEWFSYTRKQQSFLRINGNLKHQFYRLLGLKNKNLCVSYEAEWLDGKLNGCSFKKFDDTFLSATPMFQRPIRFIDHEHLYGHTSDYHKENLLGLGAMLFNIHDHYNKYLKPVDHADETKENLNEWIVDDAEKSGQRFHLFFKRPNKGYKSSCHLYNLLRVEVYKKEPIEAKQVDSDGLNQAQPFGPLDNAAMLEKVLNYNLEVEFDIREFSTYLLPHELDQAFEIPNKCPPLEDVSEDDDSYLTRWPETDSSIFESTRDSKDFISFDEFFALERNYRISSTWSYNSGSSFNLVEYLYFNQDKVDLVAKIDVLPSVNSDPSITYYILYASNLVLSFDGQNCAAAQAIDQRLEQFSSPMTLCGLANNCKLRHYGLGNLWRLCSGKESPIEFMGEYRSSHDNEFHKIWRTELNSFSKHVQFDFVVADEKSGDRISLSLNSVSLEEDHHTVLRVSDIKIGHAEKSDNSIPSACNIFLIEAQSLDKIKFPTFKHTFRRDPTIFKINYDLAISYKGELQELKVLEACQGNGNCLVYLWKGRENLELRTVKENSGSYATLIYEPLSLHCTRSTNLIHILGLDKLFEVLGRFDNNEFLGSDPLLLVNLWEVVGNIISRDRGIDPTQKKILRYGREYLLFEWKITNNVAEISFEFEKRDRGGEFPDPQMILRNVLIKSLEVDAKSIRFSLNFQESVSFNPELPLECREILDTANYMPEMAFDRGKIFYLRSQLVRNGHVKQVEEWLEYGAAYRFMITDLTGMGVRKVADFLLLNETQESFNLTSVDECDELPKSHSHDDKSQNWFNKNILDLQLKGDFYGSLFLWSLGKDLDASVERIADDSIDIFKLFDSEYMGSWFNTELWLVKHKKLRFIIRFRREFVGRNDVEIVPKEVHVIDESDAKQSTSLEVLNLISLTPSLQDRSHREMLLIPAKRGCKRNAHAESKLIEEGLDKFDLRNNPLTFRYVATLNQINDDRPVPNPIVQSGFIGQCSHSWSPESIAGLKIRHWRTYNIQSGNMESFREVENLLTPRGNYVQRRILNERTGECMLFGPRQIHDEYEILRLDLLGDKSDAITFKSNELLSFLITEEGYQPIHRYEDEKGSIVAVYEARMSRVKLNSKIWGPASIIRTFTRTQETRRYKQHYEHSSLKLEIIVLGKAFLVLEIIDMNFHFCYNLLSEAPNKNCHVSSEMELALSDSGLVAGRRLRMIRLEFIPKNLPAIASDFIAAKKDLTNSLVRKLIEDPDPIDPMQLANIDLSFQHQDSSISAHITLVEPLSPMYVFEFAPNRVLRRSGSKMFLQVRVVESIFDCSEWCGSTDDCVAFSYCTDHSCQILTGMSRGSQNLIESYGEDSYDCSLYHGGSGSSSKRVSEIIEVMQKNIDSDDMSNKLSLTIFAKGDKSFMYVARKVEAVLEDEFSTNDHTINKKQKLHGTETFAILKSDRTFPMDDRNSIPAKITFELASSLYDCLNSCEKIGAPLCSYCNRGQLCGFATNITSWDDYSQLEDKFEEDHLNRCNIYSVYYVKGYQRLTDTSRPMHYLSERKNLSLIECSAMCSLGISQKQTRRPLSECLSFDYCLSETTGESSCYTEEKHNSIEGFGEIVYTNNSTPNDKCFHFSKNLISDYTLVKGKKFQTHEALTLKGTNIDTCIIICHRDENCVAFEYCHERKTQLTTCYIKRFADYYQGLHQVHSAHLKFVDAVDCSIYFLKNNSLGDDPITITNELSSKNPDEGLSIHSSSIKIIIFSMLSLILGIAIRNILMIVKAR